jgi:hypothetical protein
MKQRKQDEAKEADEAKEDVQKTKEEAEKAKEKAAKAKSNEAARLFEGWLEMKGKRKKEGNKFDRGIEQSKNEEKTSVKHEGRRNVRKEMKKVILS